MDYVYITLLILISNWKLNNMGTAESPEHFHVPDNFPNFPSYFHAQVRKRITTEHVPGVNGVTHEEVQHGNEEMHEERGYVDSFEDSPSKNPIQNHKFQTPEAGNLKIRTIQGGPSKILAFAATNLYDRDAHQHGIYSRRNARVACPQIGNDDPDESRNNAKFKHQLAKNYMECLKNLYFGKEPLPAQIFENPAISRTRRITVESMNKFMEGSPKF